MMSGSDIGDEAAAGPTASAAPDRTTRPLNYGGNLLRAVAAGAFRASEIVYGADLHQAPHRHTSASLTFVLAGAFSESIVGDARSCGRHAVLLKSPGLLHRCSGGGVGSHCICLEIEGAALPALGPAKALWERPAYLDGAALAPIALRLRQELRARDRAAPLAVEGLCLELVAAVHRLEVRPRGVAEPPWIEDAIRLLREHSASRFTPAELAERLDLEKTHMAREFRKHRGESVASFLRAVRLERARTLLDQSELSLADIAIQVGFCDQSHLTKVFHRHTGTTPGAYRAMCRRAIAQEQAALPVGGSSRSK